MDGFDYSKTTTFDINASPGFCPHCSTPPWSLIYHGGACPLVKAIEYYPDGTIKRIEFFPQYAPRYEPMDYPIKLESNTAMWEWGFD